MGFGDADDDVLASSLRRRARLQHRIGLADAWRRAKEYGQLAARFTGGKFEQFIGIWSISLTVIGHGRLKLFIPPADIRPGENV